MIREWEDYRALLAFVKVMLYFFCTLGVFGLTVHYTHHIGVFCSVCSFFCIAQNLYLSVCLILFFLVYLHYTTTEPLTCRYIFFFCN